MEIIYNASISIFCSLFIAIILSVLSNKNLFFFEGKTQLLSLLFISLWIFFYPFVMGDRLAQWEVSSFFIISILIEFYGLILCHPEKVSTATLNSKEYFKEVISPRLSKKAMPLFSEYSRFFTYLSVTIIMSSVIVGTMSVYFDNHVLFAISTTTLLVFAVLMIFAMGWPSRNMFLLTHYLNLVDKNKISFDNFTKVYKKVTDGNLLLSDDCIEWYNSISNDTQMSKGNIFVKKPIKINRTKVMIFERIAILKFYGVLVVCNGVLIPKGKDNSIEAG